ncbi:hypothetical protein GYMLUDRAFT_723770 [Collybiopsis luxurians FD-317 M1]|nr:hypothetical protein GYMLUDRAFT_723770 [Collybiopsis luxurians FD-317 M1]
MESSRYNTATNASHDASPSTPRAGPSRGSLNPLPRPPSLIPAFADIELGSGTLDPYYPINDTPRAQAREQSSDISLDNVQEASRRFWRTLELYRYLINASRVRLDAEIQSSLINESKQLMHFLHFMNADFMNENYTEEIEAIPQISTHVDLETWLRQREAIERVTERILRQGMLYTILQQEARPTNRVLSPPSQEPSSRARNIFSAPTLRFGSRSTDSHSNLESVGGSPEFSQSSYYSLLQHPCSGGPSRRDSSSRQEAPDTTPSRTYLVPPSPVVVDPELSIRSPRHTRHQVNHSSLPRHHSSSRRADGVSSAPGSRPASPYLHPENLIGFSPPRRLSSVPSTRVPSPSADDHSHPPLAQDSVGSFQPPDLRSQSENVEERELTGTTRRDGARLRFSVPSRSQRNRIFRTSDPRRLSIDSIPVTNSGSSPNEFEAHHSPPPPNQAPGHPVLHNARVRAPDANSGRDDPRFTLPGGSALVEPLTSSAQQNASTTRVDIPGMYLSGANNQMADLRYDLQLPALQIFLQALLQSL